MKLIDFGRRLLESMKTGSIKPEPEKEGWELSREDLKEIDDWLNGEDTPEPASSPRNQGAAKEGWELTDQEIESIGTESERMDEKGLRAYFDKPRMVAEVPTDKSSGEILRESWLRQRGLDSGGAADWNQMNEDMRKIYAAEFDEHFRQAIQSSVGKTPLDVEMNVIEQARKVALNREWHNVSENLGLEEGQMDDLLSSWKQGRIIDERDFSASKTGYLHQFVEDLKRLRDGIQDSKEFARLMGREDTVAEPGGGPDISSLKGDMRRAGQRRFIEENDLVQENERRSEEYETYGTVGKNRMWARRTALTEKLGIDPGAVDKLCRDWGTVHEKFSIGFYDDLPEAEQNDYIGYLMEEEMLEFLDVAERMLESGDVARDADGKYNIPDFREKLLQDASERKNQGYGHQTGRQQERQVQAEPERPEPERPVSRAPRSREQDFGR